MKAIATLSALLALAALTACQSKQPNAIVAPIDQAKPLIEAIDSAKADDQARFRKAFCAAVREEIDHQPTWDQKFESEARPSILKQFGNIPTNTIAFQFEGTPKYGTVTAMNGSEALLRADVVFEAGEWKLTRH